MKKFVLKFTPYLLFILAYGLVGELLLYLNKESYSITKVAEVQSTSERELYYYRGILGNSVSNYKFQMFQKKQPKVLVLGQSVTLQFRDFIFEPFEDDFYNTGLMARNVKDFNYVLDLFSKGEIRKPELVLLGVDLSLFLQHTFLDETEWVRNYPPDRAESAKSHLKGMQQIFRDRHQLRPPQIDFGFGRLGMQGCGYRRDGTFRHCGEINRYLEDSTYTDGGLIDDLKNRRYPFVEPFAFSAAKEEAYLEVLERFQELEIELILYIPPYSDAFFNEAMKDEKFRNFWEHFGKLEQKLKTKGYNVIGFKTPSGMGLDDKLMIDAQHPSEVLCALQLKQAVEENSIKGKYIDALSFNTLDSLLNSKYRLPFSFMNDSIAKLDLERTWQLRNQKTN